MLAGRFFLGSAGDKRSPKALALALVVDGDLELRYVDDKRMGKIYVSRPRALRRSRAGHAGHRHPVRRLHPGGLPQGAHKRRDQVRQFLMDKSAVASVGNAYADEILFHARLHPKTFMSKLSPEEIERLYHAVVAVMNRAVEEIAGRDEPIDVKVRDFLSVRGREGQPCPECGTTIRAVRVGDGDACFCPKCQPATRALFVDWGKLPGKPA
jgi:formamidopyrimidine-DNA glycosylase